MPKTPKRPRKPGAGKAVAKAIPFAASRIPKSIGPARPVRGVKPMPLPGKSRGR